ncbi:MAG TPA: hypothetical protein VFR29_04180 [Steroidobacteraceae bacterium]|nr:hypothetical protein [Steroidobacteraceae bacterium]
MKDALWSRALTIRDRRAADALCRPFQRHLVLSLIGRDASISELVAAGGLSMRALHYQVVRLAQLGLLKVASRTRRGGRPIKRYTAAAEVFFVPESLMKSRPGAVLEHELQDLLGRAHAGGMLFYRDRAGGMAMREARSVPADRRIAADCWQILDLDERDARQLAGEISSLVERFRSRPAHRSRKPYLLRYALLRKAVQ